MKLSLAPIQYYWEKDTLHRFYETVATSAIERVYLGETVCSKRRAMRLEDWLALGRMLRDAGKQVRLSSLVLLESASEVAQLKRLIEQDEFIVEANDMTAVSLCRSAQRSFVIGSHLNVYNAHTLSKLQEFGGYDWVAPVEMTASNLSAIVGALSNPLSVEVSVYGHLPLAHAARCFTARARSRSKDNCEWVCREDASGLLLHAQDGEALFVLNGVQTQMAHCYNLLGHRTHIRRANIEYGRIWLNADNWSVFWQEWQGGEVPNDMPRCNGFWFGKEGKAYVATGSD